MSKVSIEPPIDKESIWSKLNSVTVEKEKKGRFDYLSWTDMWQEVHLHYPEIQFVFKEFDHPIHGLMDCMIYPDGSASVHCTVTIEGLSRDMWLAVTDHSNNAKKTWNVTDIANTKMRCLVKCVSLFGLGAHVYRGEEIADREPPKQAVKTKPKAQKEEVVKIEDIPQEEPILYDGHAWTPQHFVTSFKSIQESDLGATTKESLLEMWKNQKEQFTLLKDNDSELYDELINFLAVTKANLPSEEIYEQGDKDEK